MNNACVFWRCSRCLIRGNNLFKFKCLLCQVWTREGRGTMVRAWSFVASQFVITFQFVINYYKLERICNTIASQYVINYYKLERICTAAASQFVINYYKLARICNVFAFQFVIKYFILDDTQSTLENKGERSLPLSSRYRVNVGFDILIIHIIKLT